MPENNSATLNSLNMHIDGCWKIRELVPFMQQGALRGFDYTAAGVDGDTFRPKPQGSLVVTVPILFYGLKDKDGAAHTHEYAGLRDNIEQAFTSWVEASKTSTIPLVVTYEDGATRQADVYCPRMPLMSHNGYLATVVRAELEIVVLAGKLTAP